MPPVEHRDWPVLLSDALYRRLLVLYPRAFRSAFGAEMAQVFRDRVRDQHRLRGDIGVLALWPAALRDLVAAAAAEHLVEERHMSRKIAVLAGCLALLISAVLAIALPQALYGLVGMVDGVLNVVAYRPFINLLFVVYGLVHSLPLALVLVTLVFQLCLLLLWHQQTHPTRVLHSLRSRVRQPDESHRGEPQELPPAPQDLNRPHHAHPVGAAVWCLLQALFLYALYFGLFLLFTSPVTSHALALLRINSQIYPFLPKLTVVPDTHFLWLQGAYSLLTPDPWHILPVVAAMLTALVVHLVLRRDTAIGRGARRRLLSDLATSLASVGAAMLTLFVAVLFPAGLALSWGLSMLFTVAQYTAVVGHSPWS